MQILKKDLKHGKVMLRIDNPEDLWHLEHILEPGNLVKSRTMRKVSVKAGGEHKLVDKKPMTLTIALEKTGFDETSGTLRLSGKIVEGPPDTKLSSYHTLQVKPGSVITVEKPGWMKHQLRRIEESRVKRPVLLLCAIDREEADIAKLLESGLKMLGHIESQDPENREAYHSEILRFVGNQQGWERLIIAGPGFEAENMIKFIRESSPDVARKCMLEKCSHTGISGISEVIKRSGERLLRETRVAREAALVEEVLSRIKSGGLVTYGHAEVRKAVALGAVETLIVSREKIKDFEQIAGEAERMGGEVSFVTADHGPGEQFLHLGGIAALLRFRIE